MATQLDSGFGGIDACPACGSARLLAVHDRERANFRCDACDQCWHLSLGWAERVDPQFCDTCAERGRCLASGGVLDLTVDSTASV